MKAIEAAERGLDESTSVFIAWAAKHDVDVSDREADSLRLKFGAVDDIRQKLREGFDIWMRADMPEKRYQMAKIQYQELIQSGLNSVEDAKETKTVYRVAWKYLD